MARSRRARVRRPLGARRRAKPPADRDHARPPERRSTPHDNPHCAPGSFSRASALFVAVGGLVGGTSGIVVFLVIAIGFNFAMFWFSDRIALKMSRARPLEPGEAPELVADVEDTRAPGRIPAAPPVPAPVPAAERVRDGPEPPAFRRRRRRGLGRADAPRAGPGMLAHECAHTGSRDVLVTTVAAMIGAAISAVANFLELQRLGGGDDDESPLGLDRVARRGPGRAGRGDDAPVRDLPSA